MDSPMMGSNPEGWIPLRVVFTLRLGRSLRLIGLVCHQVENKKKNRYPDKLPYDHNRVLLNALVNGSNSDYINASTVVCRAGD